MEGRAYREIYFFQDGKEKAARWVLYTKRVQGISRVAGRTRSIGIPHVLSKWTGETCDHTAESYYQKFLLYIRPWPESPAFPLVLIAVLTPSDPEISQNF